MAVAVVIYKSASRAPPRALIEQAGLGGHVTERAITVIVEQHVVAEVGEEQVFVPVIVVIADADALSPTAVRQACLHRDIGERAVAVVLEQMTVRLLARRKAFEPRAIYDENIEPAVVVVVVEGNPAAGGFQQVFVLVLAAKNGFGVQSGLFRDVDERHAEVVVRSWWLR